MMKNFDFLKSKKWPSWMPELTAILGAVLYLIQALIYAHTTIPGLDEGSYLLKGMLYLRGVYEPFEPYGPLTNKAPFAFLIPGFVEYLFGPGLRTGRYFAVFLGLMIVLGTWIVARRWAGRWMAAAVVWVFALSPMVIKIHAITASEVIIACMLAWMCVFVLGEERPLWQIIAGAALAACAVLTRQNMAPLLPLLILYVFWQHGKQKGIWAFAVGSVIFLAVHAYYWPNILVIWAPWLPESMTPFLNPFRLPADATPVWDPSVDFWNRLLSFFHGVRYHFIPVVGGIIALCLWPHRSHWKSVPAFRAAIFLAVIYFILFALHAWAAVASQYESYSCVFCFTPYLTFFDPLGILLIVIVLSCVEHQEPGWVKRSILIFVLLLLAAGIGYSLFEAVGPRVLNIAVPRMRDGQILPGSTLLVDFIRNKFGFNLPGVKRLLSTLIGLGISLMLMLVLWRVAKRKNTDYTYALARVFLILGIVLSPLFNMGGSALDCRTDLILANEGLGHYLDDVIPANSLVYWEGGLSFVPVVYVPDIRIFPPQINNGYTFRIGGDPNVLHRLGHWNSTLNERWIHDADIFIVEIRRYQEWSAFLNSGAYEEYAPSLYLPSCQDGAGLRIFHKLP
jgi:hypothetical protein